VSADCSAVNDGLADGIALPRLAVVVDILELYTNINLCVPDSLDN